MSFGGLFFTNNGKTLQAKAQTGVQLNFTRIGIGDGELSGQDISELTDLIHQVKSLDLNKFKTLPGGKAVVGGVLSNQGLATGFYWRELGLFATDPDVGEILYCYGNAGALAEYIPADGGAEILEKQVNVVSLIGNAVNVTATIEQSLVYATQEDINDLAGAGRTTETVKSNADMIAAMDVYLTTLEQSHAVHLADYVRQPGYGTTGGSANTYTLSLNPALSAYVAGVCVAVKIHAANTASSTININGLGAKTIKDSKGNNLTSGKLMLNGVYTLRYDGTNFILQGEGASGNATASDLLSGKTASTDAGDIVGTMPNRGAVNITPSTVSQTIQEGYHSGAGAVASLGGNAVANEVLTGKSFSSDSVGRAIAGAMPNRGSIGTQTITTQNGQYTIPAGYHNGAGIVKAVFTNLIAGNIKKDINVGGIIGTLVLVQFASGTALEQDRKITVSGLSFKPRLILFWAGGLGADFTTNGGIYLEDYGGNAIRFHSSYNASLYTPGPNSSYTYYVEDGGFRLQTMLIQGINHAWIALKW